MAGNTFIQVPSDITNTVTLRRFLEKLSLQVDTAFSKRGTNGFITGLSIEELVSTISELERDISNIQSSITSLINSLNTRVRNLEAGDTVVTISADYDATSESTKIICDNLTEISVTLPDPADFLFNGRSMLISITTKNIGAVNILPFSTELIAGEATQSLIVPSESLTFFTDSVDWYIV